MTDFRSGAHDRAVNLGISGRTRIFGIVADPIAHVKTPEVMNALFAAHGVDGVMIPLHVPPAGLAPMLDGLRRMENFGGFIATVPHKPAMLDLCDEIEPEARRIGAANCVRREADGRFVGAMLDGIGFVEGLNRSGIDPAGMAAYVVGAGGAACALAFALAGAGVRALTIANRTPERAEGLIARVRAAYPALTLSAESGGVEAHDLVVNATTLGMRADDPAPVDFSRLHDGQIVCEVIMEPATTPFLAAAAKAGCRVHPGRPMLDAQIELMARHLGALDGARR